MSDKTICGAEKDDGGICESPFVGENGRCAAHDPEKGSEEMKRRGRAGAKVTNERREAETFDVDALPPLEDMDAVRAWAEEVGRACARGAISEKRANSLSRLLRQARQAMEAEVGNRLEELREKVEEARKRAEEPSWKA